MVRNSSHPQSITHPCDENHVLFLTSAAGFSCSCNACGEVADGLCYSCQNCNIDLHTRCASMPMTLFHRSHDHQLALVFSVPYPNKCFTCNVCRDMGCGQWLYRCGLCGFDVHLVCAGMVQGEGYRVHAHHQVQTPHPSVHCQYQVPLPGPYPMPYNAANSSNIMHHAAAPARPSMGNKIASSFIVGAAQALGTDFLNLALNEDLGDY